MTCKELGGACDEKFEAYTFEEIAKKSKYHGMQMFAQGEPAHVEAMENMKKLMAEPGAVDKWMDERRTAFEAMPEN